MVHLKVSLIVEIWFQGKGVPLLLLCNSTGTYTVEYWVSSEITQNLTITSNRSFKKKKKKKDFFIMYYKAKKKKATVLGGWHCKGNKDNKDLDHIEVLECVLKCSVYKS